MKKTIKLISISLLVSAWTLNADDTYHQWRYPNNLSDNAYIIQHVQATLDNAKFIVFDLDKISAIKDIPDDQKMLLGKIYIIDVKTGNIVLSPSENIAFNNNEATVNAGGTEVVARDNAKALLNRAPDGNDIVNLTIKHWKLDESKIIYDIGNYFTTIAITKDRTLYVIALPDIYLGTN